MTFEPPVSSIPTAPPEPTTANAMAPVEFTFSEADMVAANRAWWTGTATWQRFARAVGLLWLGYALVCVGLDLAAVRRHGWIAVLVAGVVAVTVMLVLYGLGYALTPRRARKAFREHKIFTGRIAYRWDAENLYATTPRTTSTLPWGLFHAWLDGPETVLLLQTSVLFNPVLKRALSPGQLADIIGHLRAAGVPEMKRFGFLASPGGSISG